MLWAHTAVDTLLVTQLWMLPLWQSSGVQYCFHHYLLWCTPAPAPLTPACHLPLWLTSVKLLFLRNTWPPCSLYSFFLCCPSLKLPSSTQPKCNELPYKGLYKLYVSRSVFNHFSLCSFVCNVCLDFLIQRIVISLSGFRGLRGFNLHFFSAIRLTGWYVQHLICYLIKLGRLALNSQQYLLSTDNNRELRHRDMMHTKQQPQYEVLLEFIHETQLTQMVQNPCAYPPDRFLGD